MKVEYAGHQEVLKERKKRLDAVIKLKRPDRVPLALPTMTGGFLGKYYSLRDIYFDYNIMEEALIRIMSDFPVDMFICTPYVRIDIFTIAFNTYLSDQLVGCINGPMHYILNDVYTKWPGIELPENLPFQLSGGAYIEINEYNELSEDPVNFILETIIPRVCKNLSNVSSTRYTSVIVNYILEHLRFSRMLTEISENFVRNGWISPFILTMLSPLDIIGDYLRHPVNLMRDLFKHLDTVRLAAESLLKVIIKSATLSVPRHIEYVLIPLHIAGMLSSKIFDEIYWPQLKEIILELINKEYRVIIFLEDLRIQLLENLLELPKGWGIVWLSKADLKNVVKVLGGHTCIMGGIPTSLLLKGTPEVIEEYVRKLLECLLPSEGFILATETDDIPMEVPDTNLRALINTISRYGVILK